jgi:hypothetical protein
MSSEHRGFVSVPTFSHPNIVPLLKMEQPDLLTIVATSTIGLLLWSMLALSPPAGAVITAAGFVLGVIYVKSAPSYLNSWQWAGTLYSYLRKPNRYASTQEAAEHVNDGVFATTKQTQDLTNIKRFYPTQNIIEREDDSLVAIVEVNPPHRDFATTEDWFSTAQSIAEWYNNAVDFEFQLYATTQPFPIEAHLDNLEARMNDSDVLQNDNLQALIEERLNDRRNTYDEAGTQVAHFYLVVSIGEDDVRSLSETNQGPLERLKSVPIVDIFVAGYRYYSTGESSQTDTESRLEMAHKLQDRLATVMSLSERLDDVDMERLDTADMVALQRQFWRPGEKQASDNVMDPRSQPASMMEQPEEVAE